MRESSKQTIFDLGSSFELALSAHRQGSYEKAIHEYQKILKHNEGHRPSLLNLGVIFHVKKSYEMSLDYFLKVIELDENDLSGLYNAGKTLQSREEWSRSLDFLQKAHEVSPTDSMVVKALGKAYFKLEMYTNASGILTKYLEKNRDDIEALLMYSEAVQQQGQFDLATFGYNRVIEINPEFERVYEILSDCYASQYKIDKSVATLEKLLEFRQNDSTIYRKLAMFHGQLKNYTEARKCYWKAYTLESKEMKIHESRAVTINSDVDRATFQASILQITEKYTNSGNWKGALAEFTTLSRRYPGSSVILQEIAYIYQMIGESKRAASYYEKILDRNEDSLEAMLQLCRIAIDLEDFAYGKSWIDKALAKYPEVMEVKELAGALHTHFGEYEAGLKYFNQCKNAEFESCGVLLGSSECYLGRGEYLRSANLLKEAVKTYPESVDLVLNLARSYIALGKTANASRLMKQARKQFSGDLQVLVISAEVAITQGNLKRAGEFFTAIAQLQPHDKEDYIPFIKSLIYIRESEEALRYLKAFTRFKLKNFNHLYLESLAYVVAKNVARTSIPWQELWSLNADEMLSRVGEVKTILRHDDVDFLLQIQGDLNRLLARKGDILPKVEQFFGNLTKPATLEVVK